MTRPLSAAQRLAVPREQVDEGLQGDPADWLPAPATGLDDGAWTIVLEAGPFRREVICRVGVVQRARRAAWRTLQWHPSAGERALPAFRGRLELRPDPGGCLLALWGSYDPPAGQVGVAADSAGLHLLAQSTARRFVADVSTRLAGAPIAESA